MPDSCRHEDLTSVHSRSEITDLICQSQASRPSLYMYRSAEEHRIDQPALATQINQDGPRYRLFSSPRIFSE
jgi:hypothetical protein